jgi:DNA repair ATPase RecN
MLRELSIKNVAVIDTLTVSFVRAECPHGRNGAGKSFSSTRCSLS